jgi:uncharacterized protein YhfF
MNLASQVYWDGFWKSQNLEKPNVVTAWQFGASPDHLAQLVIEGVKTATCSAVVVYEREGEPVPSVDDYSIILNSKDEPLAIIKTVEVTIMPMNQVSEDFAIAEGEGDRTYQYWKDVHVEFFTEELAKFGLHFSEDLMLVCERFDVIDVKNKEEG